MTAKLGLPVVYLPRVPYGRQNELFGFITRVIDAEQGKVDIITFPSNSEPVHYNNVAQRSDAIQIHCWEPVQVDVTALEERVAMLELQLAEFGLVEARIAALEAKRGPGRPPNADKAAA